MGKRRYSKKGEYISLQIMNEMKVLWMHWRNRCADVRCASAGRPVASSSFCEDLTDFKNPMPQNLHSPPSQELHFEGHKLKNTANLHDLVKNKCTRTLNF